ncbi:glycoside hydrolase family 57 protein [Dehalobacterium formicoaceticum]|uniref:glycoside hydrolase family 57 protein n=1 Tax=Dehalobacterium formicoaceticum TaxID=51515 RepID=UPI000B7DA844|nr:1,4-alpha-glucan branching protein domain-containing protein [Dehalobacterium formicoaceticum]
MPQGYLALVLHAHLPYVRHVEHEHFLEERWFYEAVSDCYTPLIDMMDRLEEEKIPFRFTMSLTSPLLTMLGDPLMQNRYEKHLNLLLELADKEIIRLRQQPEFLALAFFYQKKLLKARNIFLNRYHKKLIDGFKKHMTLGHLEIITSGATHAYFPLAEPSRKTVRAQVATGIATHQSYLGSVPEGIWLPECGYYPGDDKILNEYGLKYFFLDTHGILYATHRPKYACYAPIFCPSGVAAFSRDQESSKQVWSMSEGYPGDPDYREYYRDIGFDLDYDYIYPYIHPEGVQVNTGFKYYRVTGKNQEKQVYHPEQAARKAREHALNFKLNRQKQISRLSKKMDRPPIIVAPYDAELFGHWWFEGPQFLENLFRSIAADPQNIKLITPMDYLSRFPHNQITQPCMSSWGNQGYHDVWLDESNAWIYPNLHQAAYRMSELVQRFPSADENITRTLKQAARELLLAQSSDWAFIMKTGTMVSYATERTKNHLHHFNHLYEQLIHHNINLKQLEQLENQNHIFPEIDYQTFK